jgi:hypothetical protein
MNVVTLLVKIIGKVKLSLHVTKHHAIKTYGGVEVQLHAFLISALDGDDWSAPRSGRFTPGFHWIGDWVGRRVSLDAVAKRKKSLPLSGIDPRSSSP